MESGDKLKTDNFPVSGDRVFSLGFFHHHAVTGRRLSRRGYPDDIRGIFEQSGNVTEPEFLQRW